MESEKDDSSSIGKIVNDIWDEVRAETMTTMVSSMNGLKHAYQSSPGRATLAIAAGLLAGCGGRGPEPCGEADLYLSERAWHQALDRRPDYTGDPIMKQQRRLPDTPAFYDGGLGPNDMDPFGRFYVKIDSCQAKELGVVDQAIQYYDAEE